MVPSPSLATSFAEFALHPQVLRAVESLGYHTPTEVQAQAIPHLLDGGDILGVSQTGTGKTAAFALPLLSTLDTSSKHVQILCLTPTRELAIQVAHAFTEYAGYLEGVSAIPIYGGSSYTTQIRALQKGAQIVVGTPGRVIDLIEKGKLSLQMVRSIILDEADEMLKMGFADEVKWILSHTPKDKQSVLFSATMPKQIRAISSTYLNHPKEITIQNKDTSTKNIAQSFLPIANKHKLIALRHYLEVEQTDGVIIFCRTKKSTEEVASFLQLEDYKVEALNGDITQENREKSIKKLKGGAIDIVVATDVAARGIDVNRLTHVVNFDMADDVSTYVHRIGRVGRAGRKGTAIVLLNPKHTRIIKEIEQHTEHPLPKYQFPSVEQINKTKLHNLVSRINALDTFHLGEYRDIIAILEQEHGADASELAAKLLLMIGGGKRFYVAEKISFEEDSKQSKKKHSRTRTRATPPASPANRRKKTTSPHNKTSYKKLMTKAEKPKRKRRK